MAEQFLYLTTTGRVSGKSREIEIWYVEHESKFYILAEHRERADWVKNLARNPQVLVRVGERILNAEARVLDAEDDRVLYLNAQELFKKKYGWDAGLPVEIVPNLTS